MSLSALVLAFLAAGVFSSTSSGQDDSKWSEGLKVLGNFVGTWDLVVNSKPYVGKDTTRKTTETREWSIGGKYVHFNNPNKNDWKHPEFHLLLTYAPISQMYPGVMMYGRSRYTVMGSWDKKAKTMTIRGTGHDERNSIVIKNRFVDEDNVEKTVIITQESTVVMEQIITQVRRKK